MRNIKNQYDNNKSYIKGIDDRPWNKYYERPAMIDLLPDLKGKTLLDVGCGTGYYTEYAYKKSAKVISTDISKEMIEVTRKKVGQDVLFYQNDLDNGLPFLEDDCIDIIVCSLVLHYIEDWAVIIKHFYRVLKKGGICIISFHHPISDYIRYQDKPYLYKHLVDDVWESKTAEGEDIKVSYYIRPLSETINYFFDSSFSKIKLIEPYPKTKYKEQLGSKYDRFINKPGFLFVYLEK